MFTCKWMFSNWRPWNQSGKTKDKRIQLAEISTNWCLFDYSYFAYSGILPTLSQKDVFYIMNTDVPVVLVLLHLTLNLKDSPHYLLTNVYT